MSVRKNSSRAHRSYRNANRGVQVRPSVRPAIATRRTLLAGTSLLALVLGLPSAHAISVGSGTSATTSATTIASDAARAAAQQAQEAARKAQQSLSRATQALQSMQAIQAAARAAAQARQTSTTLPGVAVPNGLTPGGLVPNPAAGWSGANAPTQKVGANGATSVNIQQTAPQAILSWQTFNVGSQTTVNFNQQASNWTALNRVTGNLGPSQILGNINAIGQVLVINQNGIIFGGGSQVNVGSLIASTANITDNQFLANGIYSTQSGSNYRPSFTGAGGKIVVEAGALINTNAPASVTSGGGTVLLMGTEVDNAGTITTPKGQAMLAAGTDFILRPGFATTGNVNSTTRGNEISVGNWNGSTFTPGGGTVNNTGLIFAQQGDITLAGHAITQGGILLSTTSVDQRGTIHLLNSASDATGSVTLTGDSVAAILPETPAAAALLAGIDPTATALNSKRNGLIASAGVNNLATGQFDNLSTLADRPDQSRIEIVTGGLVDLQNGSLTMAQGGQVAVSAGQRVFAEAGATVDVSGVQNVPLAMSSNEIQVNIQGNELRDSPANRDSTKLFNSNVWIDARDLILVPAGTGGYATDRYYTPGGLLEVSGYLNTTGHTIGEWTAVGGTITLSAPQVVAQQGSMFNVSGGSLQYQGGYLAQSTVMGSDGRYYSVNTAPSYLTYVAAVDGFVVNHERAGVVEVYTHDLGGNKNVRWEDGYTIGRDAGKLILSTPTSIFEGSVVADVITGTRQTSARPSNVTDGYKLTQNTAPLAGTLALGQYNGYGLAGGYNTDVKFGSVASITNGLTATGVLPSDRVNTAWFDAYSVDSFNLGGLNIATGNKIAVEAPLQFAPGAQVKLVAPTVDIAADIIAHSGSVTVSNFLQSDQIGSTSFSLTTSAGTSQLTLEAGVTIDTSGLWVNALTEPDSQSNLAFLNGGNVTINSTQNVTLTAGSTVDVSSGGAILANGKTQGGKGGNVTILAGTPDSSSVLTAPATLVLDGTIRAWGVTGGGMLTVSSPGNLLIGSDASLSGGVLNAGTPAPVALTLKQDLVVPAGQPLPYAQMNTLTSLAAGEPAPVDLPLGTVTNLFVPVDWTVPPGMGVWVGSSRYEQGGNPVVPAGSVITSTYGQIKAGTVIDASIFPNGFPIVPYQLTYAAGAVRSVPTIYLAGSTVPAGAVLPEAVAVAPAPVLGSSFFSAGFSNYDINAGLGLLVTPGTSIAATVPVYQFTAGSYAAPTGSDPSTAMSLWTPPLFIENPMNATLAQRSGASLTLHSVAKSGNGLIAGGGSIVIGDNASLTVDPGRSIKLDAFGQITVSGGLTAHGGSIILANDADGNTDAARNFDAAGNVRGVSIWIGAKAKLDVSGTAYGASDSAGRSYGQATDGGAITVNGGGAFVIIRPGAELDADGTQVAIDLAARGNAQTPLALASNGGSITLSSQAGLYLDGDMHAFAGGPGAAGGNLSISLFTPSYYDPDRVLPQSAFAPSTMVVTQAYQPSLLPDDIVPGTGASSLHFGEAAFSAERIKAGGFDNLTLSSGDYMQFSGDVSLALGRSLTLTAAAFSSGAPVPGPVDSSTPATTNQVRVSAPYILFSEPTSVVPDGSRSGTIRNPGADAMPTAATFEANASQIDIQGLILFSARAPNDMHAPGFMTTKLVSHGDIRFLPMAGVTIGQLATSWNLDLVAAQIYPATGVSATIIAGQNNYGYTADQTPTLTIGRSTSSIPDAPLSASGSLAFQAPIVEQGGIVRAPFGTLAFGTGYPIFTSRVDLLPGSLTSVSMAGLTIPYGGTVDGVTYNYAGSSVIGKGLTNVDGFGRVQSGITLDAQSTNVASGAILDLSGGGTLSGAGFISGRGGSVNVLNTPLVNANPSAPLSKASDKVYAILPGYASSYAPVAPENGAGDPAIGQQVTIPAGVPGLPAGTYTLLPSNYALLPGAYRVELGGSSTTPITSPIAVGNGTYAASVTTGIANTAIRGSLPVTALITSGTAVRNYSQYNEQGYADFLIAKVTQFGGVRPLLPADGKALMVQFEAPTSATTGSALTFDGTALFQGAQGGVAGQAVVQGIGEIYADAPADGLISVRAADLNAIAAPRLLLNGYEFIANNTITFNGGGNLVIRDGVTLTAAELFLVGTVTVGNNVTLTTVGRGAAPFDTNSTGLSYDAHGFAVLALSNGNLEFLGSGGGGAITVGANSQLYSEGTLAFATSGASTIDPSAHFGSRNIALAVGAINVGDSVSIAAAGAPDGLLFDQALLNTLLKGDPLHGAPALERITLSAGNSINLFGSAGIDATGSGVDLVLNTPAIYGYGTSGDRATIAANKITWNGIAGATPPAIAAGGPGTGTGTFNLFADEIDLGRFASLDTSTASRAIYGFNNVNMIGSSKIVSAGNSKLFVYQSPSSDPAAVFGQSGTGGNLTLTTPLLTGLQKSVMAYVAGGALNVVAPTGVAPSAAKSTVSGAEIDLTGDSVAIGSTILLPSGKLVVDATNDIALNAGSRIDLSGQPSQIQKATVYGFGGTAILNSAQGGLTQAAGSTIDVSATRADAGSVSISAVNGPVALHGMLNGAATGGATSGGFSVKTATLSNADFAALNALLTQGGFFDTRSFDVRTGDLVIGDGVKARNVAVSVDGGSLTVAGTIDASGAAPGTIRLSAGNGLTLASNAVLDAHGTVLQVDSYGHAIEAKNRGHIELTASGGTLTLSPGATLDLTTPNGVAYGDVQLNAQRTGETSGDIAIDAAGPLTIKGAYSIALNAFWTYDLPGGSTITQATLDGYDTASTSFINAALANGALQGRVAGLSAYGGAYHLRPGVQITSSGDLSTSGDVDLAKYRYGANADRDPNSATYGAGEPMALVVRASGGLTINGSISDGFGSLPGTPPTYSTIDITNSPLFNTGPDWCGPYSCWADTAQNVTILTAWTIPNDDYFNNWWGPLKGVDGQLYRPGDTIPAGTELDGRWGVAFEGSPPPVVAIMTSPGVPGASGTSATAPMLAPGSLSTSIRFVAGADVIAADQRLLQTTQALAGRGNLTLNDPAYNASLNGTFFSVLRTGTGSLDLLAGGSFSEATPYGVYTAGTQSSPILSSSGTNPYDVAGAAGRGSSHAW